LQKSARKNNKKNAPEAQKIRLGCKNQDKVKAKITVPVP
jgi:hypothetical protein